MSVFHFRIGSTGSAGGTGVPGYGGGTGSTGSAGSTGIPGATGPAGASGSAGSTGDQGRIGVGGRVGRTGAIGQAGAGIPGKTVANLVSVVISCAALFRLNRMGTYPGANLPCYPGKTLQGHQCGNYRRNWGWLKNVHVF